VADDSESVEWQVEGAADDEAGTGLEDTVVRIPRIPADGSFPTGGVKKRVPKKPAGPKLPKPPAFGEVPPPPPPPPPPAEAEVEVEEPAAEPEPLTPPDYDGDATIERFPEPKAQPEPEAEPPADTFVDEPAATAAVPVPVPAFEAPVLPAAPAIGAAAAAAAAATAATAAEGEATTTLPAAGKKKRRKPRKARLRVAKFDPWSVMKTSFMFSIALGVITFVAIWATWNVIAASGIFDSLNEAVAPVVSNPTDTTPWRIQDYISDDQVFGAAAILAAVSVVIFTALGTIAAFLYNLASNVIGGIEITLSDK
jgi:hypothetical protein